MRRVEGRNDRKWVESGRSTHVASVIANGATNSCLNEPKRFDHSAIHVEIDETAGYVGLHQKRTLLFFWVVSFSHIKPRDRIIAGRVKYDFRGRVGLLWKGLS